ncbi:hypothetical protein TD95_005343 [Thielaviopsis punctulata]|uniref:L-lactate dehydrogenase (cytochrome) n=1 Tax=Thielaviopsis punctulata TaxID=72032 RepID=A0A0F4ZAD0_9PEZI|nr:hypothetical protein TD95_005343 [Thielaviopsis punctulata]
MKEIDATEVAKHNSRSSCWVALYGHVYDVTTLIDSHPGGAAAILKYAGKDATEDFDAIHPAGTLDSIPESLKLGTVDSSTLSSPIAAASTRAEPEPVRLEALLNIDDIEHAATQRLSRKAWAYYFSASDDMLSKTLNNSVYRQILLRPRILTDCTLADTSTRLLCHRVATPIFVSPAALARLAHPSGERGIAAAAAARGAIQIISQNASMSPEEIVAGAPAEQVFGWQVYVQKNRAATAAMLQRINALRRNIKFLVLTVDAPVPGKRELDERQQFEVPQDVVAAVGAGQKDESGQGGRGQVKGGFGKQLFFGTASDLTWKTTLGWLAEQTDLPIVIKGVQTHEDAALALEHAPQVRGLILSNHGGRALDTAPPPVHTLLEIRRYCPRVLREMEVWVDGGIRRGTDVVKALCLGARGVGIGRAALFGLGAGGQEGVERVFEVLTAEVETCMRLLGAKSIGDLGPHMINSRAVERDIFNESFEPQQSKL